MLAYDELKGSSGKEVWFRPPRYEGRKLFPHRPPRVRIGTATYRLHNISLGGLAAVSNPTLEDVLEVGEIVSLTIQQSGLTIFEGDARVCRTESTPFGSKVAVNFINGFVEFDKLINRNVQAQIATRASLFNAKTCRLISQEYRVFCADVLGILRSYKVLLDDTGTHPEEFQRGFDHDAAFDACEARLVQHWRSLWRLGNDLVRDSMNNREVREATKEFTELVLTPELCLGAIWDRSYGKPLGYPGDFEVMNQVYDGGRRGASAYEMLLHRLGLEVADCIRTRMEVVSTKIAEVVREKCSHRPARILSLGSGPAREVENYLASPHSVGRRAEFTLIDQETAALRYAYERTYPHILAAKGYFKVQCLNMSFMEILKGMEGLEALAPQDLIYSVGLLDYLADRRATTLVHRLYNALAPGGTLIIGNMNETSLSNLWPMEFITDWTLQYRNDAQMLAWAEELNTASVWTETDSTERVRLLFVRKP